tara:strand:- start:522 stop:866 length:345 start_codon:yes stop_codon:yes gene_type:complete
MKNKKVKELKEDAILDVKVNKTYYMMSKAALFTLLNDIYTKEDGNPDKFVEDLINKEYGELDDKQRAFYTLTLLVGEIEKQAIANDAFIEKEVDVEKLKAELKKVQDAEDSSED